MTDLDQMQDYEDLVYAEHILEKSDQDPFLDRLDRSMKRLDEIEVIIMAEKKYTVDVSKWEDKLKNLDNSSGGNYVFPQVGTTKVRLLVSPEREAEEFYEPVSRLFREQEKTQYMAPCIVFEDKTWNMDVKYLNMNKTVFKGILSIMAGGEYDLLSPDKGHAVQITRTGEGLKTQYTVLPSMQQVPVDYGMIEFEYELNEMARELEASDRKDKTEEYEDVPF